jgi:hypothetical protein
MEEINKAYATFQERDRIASLGGSSPVLTAVWITCFRWKRLKSNTKTER